MENITIANLTMMDVPDYAIYITTGNAIAVPADQLEPGRNILISNVIADGVGKMSGIQIMGLPEQPVEGVRIENVRSRARAAEPPKTPPSIPRNLAPATPNRGTWAPCPLTACMRATSKDWSWRTSPLILSPMICVPRRRSRTFKGWKLITSSRRLHRESKRLCLRTMSRLSLCAIRRHWKNNPGKKSHRQMQTKMAAATSSKIARTR